MADDHQEIVEFCIKQGNEYYVEGKYEAALSSFTEASSFTVKDTSVTMKCRILFAMIKVTYELNLLEDATKYLNQAS